MTPLENLLTERFSSAFEEFQFQSISENISGLVENALRDGEKDKVYQSIISSLISSILLLQAKIDNISEDAMQSYVDKTGLKMPAVEIVPPPAEAQINITDPFLPAGFGKLETSSASRKKFRWLLGDAPFVATLRVKNEGQLAIRIDYLSFAEGLSERDLVLKCNGLPVTLTNNTEEKYLEGHISFEEDYFPSLTSIKISSDSFFSSGDRKIVLSVTGITIQSKHLK